MGDFINYRQGGMLRNIYLIVARKASVGVYFIVTLLQITISSVDTEQE